MEIAELYNKKLVEINRRHKRVELVFEGISGNYKLTFEGFIFESELSPMDQKVLKVHLSYTLGIKALEALRFYHELNKERYRQILIEFEGSFYKKNEIICVCRDYQLK